MALDTRQRASLCPASVAVHDDGNVAGHAIRVDSLQDLAFAGAGFGNLIKKLHHSEHQGWEVYHKVS
jgi:hypothetical protein